MSKENKKPEDQLQSRAKECEKMRTETPQGDASASFAGSGDGLPADPGEMTGLLHDPRSFPAQRQAVAAKLGRLKGNAFLQRAIDEREQPSHAGPRRFAEVFAITSRTPDTQNPSGLHVQRSDEETERWQRLDWMYLEDLFCLYAHYRQRQSHTPRLRRQGDSWASLWSPEWVERNDGALLSRIRGRLSNLIFNEGNYRRLEWYRRFVSEVLADAQRNDARGRLSEIINELLAGASSEIQEEDARRRLQSAFRAFGTGRAHEFAFTNTLYGVGTPQMGAFSTVLRVFRQATMQLSQGQEPSVSAGARGMIPEARAINPEHVGVEAARAAWDQLSTVHRQALRYIPAQQRLRNVLTDVYCALLREANEDGVVRANEIEGLCALGNPNF
jgi:hypothetical protein